MGAILRCLGVWLTLAGCAARPTAPAVLPPPPSARPAPAESSTLQDRGWAVVRAPALGLKLALPEAKAWLATSSSSFELRHEPTATTLSVRRWRGSRLPRVEACEAELRARTADWVEADETSLVSRREVRAPKGFFTRITLVALPGKSTKVSGRAIAIGASVGECLALVARTECETETELAERLRLLDVTLSHVRALEVEDRVPPPQPPER